jgi:hypothetical protein
MMLLTAGLAVVALAGCGSSARAGSAGGGAGADSASAASLLKETFTGAHNLSSGVLAATLTVEPTGSNTLTAPITLSFGGPFESHGAGKLPESDFSITLSESGHGVNLGILSTGAAGYVSLDGTSYRLPAASFQKVEQSFASASGSGQSSGTGLLGGLGIDPLGWLVHPVIAGAAVIGDASTTEIRAGLDVAGLLGDLSAFLAKASASGIAGANTLHLGLSAATRQKIAAEVRAPAVDVWTGNADHTMRRLEIALTLPVSGTASSVLGGLSSARIALAFQYSDLNDPRKIVAPSSAQPFSAFTARLGSLVQGLESGALSSSGLSG